MITFAVVERYYNRHKMWTEFLMGIFSSMIFGCGLFLIYFYNTQMTVLYDYMAIFIGLMCSYGIYTRYTTHMIIEKFYRKTKEFHDENTNDEGVTDDTKS